MAQHTIEITSHSEGMKSEIQAGNHQITIDEPEQMGGTDLGADPLATMLGSLAGCETVIANMVAKEIDFDLQGISFDINGTLDPRGLMGTADVKPYFDTVNIEAKVETSESQDRVEELQEITDKRCPVFTTLQAADVQLNVNWTKA
ncbi:OsmC family protein [Halobacillus yeomjeoni]|uniref:OsmC family protein n=1 Tax=Halobacillus yeomjeoni TaxID=311194 RepID=A0A931MWT0_9BACI|nr:OsmC family protein [Halobacillus yeomjeoni]MBH0231690.1 OsmC family protein [Halobacillus yeomjeoni]MCA0984987.1 OsmC family protein [Halobacillus yeomjeoni]